MNVAVHIFRPDRPASAERTRGIGVVMEPAGTEMEEGSDDPKALLIAIAERRDRQAYARLFRQFAPRLKAFLTRGGLPAVVAEELAQEAMLSVWRKAGYFDPERGSAVTWIFTITRNLKIDHQRASRRAAPVDLDPADEPEAPKPADDLLLTAEREEQVRDALKSLSEEQLQVVRLAFFSEKTHSEIARDLGLPLGTVKSRVRLALARLKSLLGDPS